MPQAYCVKDRKMVEMKDPQQVTLKNGRSATQGTCPDCGTKVTRIGGGAAKYRLSAQRVKRCAADCKITSILHIYIPTSHRRKASL